MNSETRELVLLVDNGSIRDHAVLFTRKLATQLQAMSGKEVISVSLDHSYRIPLEKLNGQPVPMLNEFLAHEISAKYPFLQRLRVVPFLLAEGGAIYRKIVSQVDLFCEQYPRIECVLEKTLLDKTESGPGSISAILSEKVIEVCDLHHLDHPEVIIVDHGSPFLEVATLRNWVAEQVEKRLVPQCVSHVFPASMERRSGSEYDFNEPLLETKLRELGASGKRHIVVVKLFLQPGKHSGKRGDIEGIVNTVRGEFSDLSIWVPKQVFSQKDLISILLRRLLGK